MRAIAHGLLLAAVLGIAGPALADGLATNANALPVHLYAGALAPGERDDYPHASPVYFLCTGGFQLVGQGTLVHVVVPDGEPSDTLVLHSFLPDAPWSRVETLLTGAPPQATTRTADFVAGCPFFGLEARDVAHGVTYLALTCRLFGPCPAAR